MLILRILLLILEENLTMLDKMLDELHSRLMIMLTIMQMLAIKLMTIITQGLIEFH